MFRLLPHCHCQGIIIIIGIESVIGYLCPVNVKQVGDVWSLCFVYGWRCLSFRRPHCTCSYVCRGYLVWTGCLRRLGTKHVQVHKTLAWPLLLQIAVQTIISIAFVRP